MEVKVKIIIQSHLSDSSIEIDFDPQTAQKRIEFVKYLINKFGKNLDEEIDPEKEYSTFLNLNNNVS